MLYIHCTDCLHYVITLEIQFMYKGYILNHFPLFTVTALILKFNKIVYQNKARSSESGGFLAFAIIKL